MALDQLDAQSVLGLPPDGLLAQFNQAGVLVAADVHVALMLGRLGRDGDELVALAAALAVRAPRVGHVLADLATVREDVYKRQPCHCAHASFPGGRSGSSGSAKA